MINRAYDSSGDLFKLLSHFIQIGLHCFNRNFIYGSTRRTDGLVVAWILDLQLTQIRADEDRVKIIEESGSTLLTKKLEKQLSKNIKEYLGVSALVKLVEPKTIQRSEGKAQRVIDNRQI